MLSLHSAVCLADVHRAQAILILAVLALLSAISSLLLIPALLLLILSAALTEAVRS